MQKAITKAKSQVEQDQEFLLEAPEICIFLVCLGIITELGLLERTFKTGGLRRVEFLDRLNAELARLTKIVEAMERFDIVLPVMDYGRFSPFFWRWFNWWHDYIKGLTPTQLGHVHRWARNRLPAVSQYRPPGHWLRYRHAPAFSLVLV